METEIMTLKEVSEYLRLNEKTVSRIAQEGRLPAQNWHANGASSALQSTSG